MEQELIGVIEGIVAETLPSLAAQDNEEFVVYVGRRTFKKDGCREEDRGIRLIGTCAAVVVIQLFHKKETSIEPLIARLLDTEFVEVLGFSVPVTLVDSEVVNYTALIEEPIMLAVEYPVTATDTPGPTPVEQEIIEEAIDAGDPLGATP